MRPKLIKILRRLKYTVYEKPYQLNIFGIRSPETISNKFDDELHVFYRNDEGVWRHFKYAITTDPGTYWLKNPMQVNGTAILKPGQYIDAYRLGLHKGEYKALIQAKPITILREYNRSAIMDFYNGKQETGLFGIDIHRSSATGSSQTVDKWSAGCQVFQNIKDFEQFLDLCEIHRSKYGNVFTYSLLDLRMLKKAALRYSIYAGGATAGLIGLLWWGLRKQKSKIESHVNHS